MPNIDLSILNQRQTPAFYADVFANRPAAGFVGRIFVSTDTYAFYRDNGTSWDLIGGPGTGTITGSGSSGSLALWNGTNTITYDVAITWNGTDNSISADKFIVNSGTSSQFLKGDGSLDSSAYVTTNIYNGNGTLSGERTVSLNGNNLIFDGGASIARVRMDADTNVARIFSFATNNLPRWAFRIDGTESGSDAGSDFAIRRYNDAGTFVDAPLTVTRSTGQSTFAKKVVIENNAGDQQLQIVSTTAPSLRIDNLQTGATKRIGLGLATAVNNFIQGSVDQDFCIFNSTTTASPILFGIYDAGLTNTQEAARISAARNFLVGTSVDAGQKLQVNGTLKSGNITLSTAQSRIFSGATDFAINNSTNTANLLLIDNGTGAATFSSSVTATTLSLGSVTPSSNGIYLNAPSANFANYGYIKTNAVTFNTTELILGSTYGFGTPVDALTLFNGTATFSSTVRSTGFYTSASQRNYLEPSAIRIAAPNDTNVLDLSVSNSLISIGSNYYSGGNYMPVSLYAGNFTQLYLNTTGNVLIGTTTDAGDKLQVNGAIKTASPSGGTAGSWKLGTATSGAAVQGGTVRIEINGVAYDLLTT